jgi:hypothetical protein
MKVVIGFNLGDLVLVDLVLQDRSGRLMLGIRIRNFRNILQLFLYLRINRIIY